MEAIDTKVVDKMEDSKVATKAIILMEVVNPTKRDQQEVVTKEVTDLVAMVVVVLDAQLETNHVQFSWATLETWTNARLKTCSAKWVLNQSVSEFSQMILVGPRAQPSLTLETVMTTRAHLKLMVKLPQVVVADSE